MARKWSRYIILLLLIYYRRWVLDEIIFFFKPFTHRHEQLFISLVSKLKGQSLIPPPKNVRKIVTQVMEIDMPARDFKTWKHQPKATTLCENARLHAACMPHSYLHANCLHSCTLHAITQNALVRSYSTQSLTSSSTHVESKCNCGTLNCNISAK